jgi:hypothetical protein
MKTDGRKKSSNILDKRGDNTDSRSYTQIHKDIQDSNKFMKKPLTPLGKKLGGNKMNGR